jgi:hypothetical protein
MEFEHIVSVVWGIFSRAVLSPKMKQDDAKETFPKAQLPSFRGRQDG